MKSCLAVACLVLVPSVSSAEAPVNEMPQCGTMQRIDETLVVMFTTIGMVMLRSLATLIPHAGVVTPLRGAPSLHLSWPWSLPFGKPSGESIVRLRCSEDLRFPHRPHRLVVEPGLHAIGKSRGYGRLGYRLILHRESERLGVGFGVGSTFITAFEGDLDASIGLELLYRAGECCFPGYLLSTLRYDRFLGSERTTTITYNLGFTYF